MKASPKISTIAGEIARIGHTSRVPKHSGWLLSVLHTTRVLDTTLSELLRLKGWAAGHSLGDYLKLLRTKSVLQPAEYDAWMKSIVNRRNRYMHEAGEMPDQVQADTLLSEMQSCVTVILGRV